LGTAAEAAVYSYIGIALYSIIPTWWSFSFIGILFAVCVIFRIISVFGVFYTASLCCRRKTINCRELTFISYGGMIRGAIAFALVLQIPYEGGSSCTAAMLANDECFKKNTYEMLVSSTLAIVMMTTLLFGTFMPAVQKILCPPTIADQEDVQKHQRALSTISAAFL
jgi:NhaP-type Na+/H+ or K+/H+ antiporter